MDTSKTLTVRRRTGGSHTLLILTVLLALIGATMLVSEPVFANHGGEHQDGIPIYGDHMKNPTEADDCRLVDFTFEDGHTNKFYACGQFDTNDLTPAMIPELHVNELHVSCSDSFVDTDGDGFGNFQKGDPTAADGSGRIHEVASWRVVHYRNENATTGDKNEPIISQRGIDKDCGQTFQSTRDIVCTTSTQTVNSGGSVDYTFNATENSNPAVGVDVLFSITSGSGTITSANPATTDGNGDATVTVQGNSPGTITIQGVFDADGDGTADSTEPTDTCTLEVNDTHAIVCQTNRQTVNIGQRATYTFLATTNSQPAAGATIIASVPSGNATVISVGGTAGSTGQAAGDGTVAVVVEGDSVTSGPVDVRASYDVDGSGTITSGEPSANCQLEVNDTHNIVCQTNRRNIDVGDRATFTYLATSNGQPASGATIIASVPSGNATVISVGGTNGDTGTTAGDGTVAVIVEGTSLTSGPVDVRASYDVDGSGTITSGEPSANCLLEVNDVHDIVCQTGLQVIDIGDRATYTFLATRNRQPASGATIIASVPSGNATVISVGGTNGDTGTTAGDGTVAVVVEGDSVSSGQVDVRASYDVNGNGTVDSGEPTDDCLLRVENPPISATVDKTNDADRNGTFTDDELAAAGPGQDVQFRVVIQNTSSERIVIDSLRDEFPDGAANATSINLANDSHSRIVANSCDDLIGDVLAPQGQAGDDATCTFTLRDYAPAVLASPLDDRVFLQVHEEGDTSNTDTDDDDSRVRTEGDIRAEVIKTNDANRNGTFTDDETAPDGPGQNVNFHVRIVNRSNVAVIIDTLRDSFPIGAASPTTINLLAANPAGLVNGSNTCAVLAGAELAKAGDPGDSVTCTFTASNYAPPLSNNRLDNRVHLEVHQKGDTTKRDTDEDDSTVRTEGDITAVVDKTNDANRNGTFTDDELAADGPGQNVRFRVEVRNTSPNAAVVIDVLRDEFPDGAQSRQAIDLLDDDAPGLVSNTCDDLRNRRLSPAGTTGDRADCEFVVAEYAPAVADSPLDNRVFLEVHMDGDTSRRDADNDDSRVRTDRDDVTTEVDKTNDADGDGTFTDDELAEVPGQDVTFQVHIENTSAVNIVIDSLTDSFPDGASNATEIDLNSEAGLVDNTCDELIGTVLTPAGTSGDSATCTFTVPDYAPSTAASPLDNRVFLEVHEEGDEDNRDEDDDDSRVRTEGDVTVLVDKTNDADLNDIFEDDETADEEGQDVTFRVVVTNTSDVTVVLDELRDEFPVGASNAQVINLLDPNAPGLVAGSNTCLALAEILLAPGDSETCEFIVADYAPADDGVLDNRVTVEVHRDGDESQRASDDDDSRVRTVEVEEVEAGGETRRPAPTPVLPRTGSDSGQLSLYGSTMVLFGMLLLAAAALLDRRGLAVVGGGAATLPLGDFLDKQLRWARDDFRRYRESRTTLWGRAAKQLRWARNDIRDWLSD